MRKHPVVPALAIASGVPALMFGCGGEVTPSEAAAAAALCHWRRPWDQLAGDVHDELPEAPSATSRPMP